MMAPSDQWPVSPLLILSPCLMILRPPPSIYTSPVSQNIRDVTLDRKIRRLKARKYGESQTEGEYNVLTVSGDDPCHAWRSDI